MFWSGTKAWKGQVHDVIVMQLLGPNLQDMVEKYGIQLKISLRCVLFVIINLAGISIFESKRP
jgi:hypothetical protein